jgi:Holliday junction resolvasome RuvABC endonuclease subunit
MKRDTSSLSGETCRNVLVLDPATSTGYALIKINNDVANIYEEGYIDVDITSSYQGDHCIDLQKKIRKLIHDHSVKEVAIEDYFFSKKFCTGSTVNAAFRTAIHILCRQEALPYTILNVSSWKTYVAGRSTPTREQKKLYGTNAKKIFIQEALWRKYGFRFPNHSLGSKGTPIAFRYDVVDVIAQSVYFCEMILHIKKTIRSSPVPEDVVMKRKVKKHFTYPAS